jgi:hypothetical protein
MALFNLTNIRFNAPGSAKGPLASLTENAEYARNTYRYPSDLGSSDKAHYMVININQQRMTSYGGDSVRGDTPQAIKNAKDYGSYSAGTSQQFSNLGNLVNQVSNSPFVTEAAGVLNQGMNKFKSFGDTANSIGNAVGGIFDGFAGVGAKVTQRLQSGSIRAEKRITDTVALYMPDTLTFQQSQSYDDIKAGGLAAGVLAGGQSVIDAVTNSKNAPEAFANAIGQASPFILSGLAKQAGGIFQVAFSQAFGVVQNPMIELIYSSPQLREFRFDFQFYPRSEQEAKEVQNIIERLRFHQAPEVAQGGTNGFFLVPPSEFDISFYYNGRINPNIPKISTCVLTNIDVDYAPGGFSAYEVPGQNATVGGTGMPVSIRLGLQFKETEIVTKTSILGRLPTATEKNKDISEAYKQAGQVDAQGKGIY